VIADVLDHLWQSTVFAGAAGLVTLLLRGNAARVRFWVWFAASVKFLVPFAILSVLGAHLLPQLQAPLPILERVAPVAEPFVMPAANAHALVAAVPQSPGLGWADLLLGIWATGTLAVAFHWLSRWWNLREALSQASDIAPVGGLSVRTAPAALEPGLFGIWRPVIVLPHDIGEKLSHAELDAVLAHEACHMAHYDNLLAAIHMLVEALFWFHPLVWWLGARLNQERERACDEAVLASGQNSEVYAESILKVCKLYVHSPLACVSGVSGADLKERMERIVVGGVASPLGATRKILLAGLGAISLAAPVLVSLLLMPAVVEAQNPAQSQIQTDTPAHIAERRAEQAMPRKAVAFNPKDFDRFVGTYQFDPMEVMTISRDGNHYLTQLTSQEPVEVFPESQTKFFAIVVPAQISFDGAGRKITELILHQGGREQHAARVSADEAHKLDAALALRIKNNTPSPGTEASLRRYIVSLENGAPNYKEMMPDLAAIVRMQAPFILQQIREWGRLKGIVFEAVDAGGMDEYDVVFERGRTTWSIAPLTADGKVYQRGFQVSPR
jgi:beta-lactamase regulating signal transducer with metallopeptidase domain